MQPTTPPTKLLSWPFLAVCAATLVHFTIIGSLAPVLPRYVAGPLGGSEATVGIVYGALGVVAMVLRPLAGRSADTRGRKRLLLVGILALGGSVAVYGIADGIPTLIALRALSGLGVACFMTAATATVYDLAPAHRRGESLSYFSLALYGGLALGPVAGEAIWETFGFDLVWLLAGILGSAAAVSLLWIPSGKPVRQTKNRPRYLHPAGVGPGLILLAAVFGQGGLQAIGALYSIEIGMEQARTIFLVFALTLLVIRSVGARLPDKIGHHRSALAALGLSSAGLALFALSAKPGGLLASTVVFAMGQSLAFPAIVSIGAAKVPSWERGALVGTVTAFLDLSLAVGGAGVARVAGDFGFEAAFLAAAAVSLIGFGGLLVSRLASTNATAP